MKNYILNIYSNYLLEEEINKIISKDLMLKTKINTVDFDEFENRKIDYIKQFISSNG